MSKLAVSLCSVQEEGLVIDAEVTEADLRPLHVEGVSLGPVTVAGKIEEVSGEYLFHGSVSGTYIHTCDRCLERMEAPFSIDVFWAFEQGIEEGPAEELRRDTETDDRAGGGPRVSGYRGGEIDLAPLAWEEVVLAQPAKFVCKPDCAGLCPQCGANLNLGPCGCRQADDGGWLGSRTMSGLGDLFGHLRPNQEED